MRDLIIRQTTAELLAQAQAAAIEAIGLRGNKAQQAMRRGARETRRRQVDERWKAIVRSAWKSRCDAVSDAELALVDRSSTLVDASSTGDRQVTQEDAQ